MEGWQNVRRAGSQHVAQQSLHHRDTGSQWIDDMMISKGIATHVARDVNARNPANPVKLCRILTVNFSVEIAAWFSDPLFDTQTLAGFLQFESLNR